MIRVGNNREYRRNHNALHGWEYRLTTPGHEHRWYSVEDGRFAQALTVYETAIGVLTTPTGDLDGLDHALYALRIAIDDAMVVVPDGGGDNG